MINEPDILIFSSYYSFFHLSMKYFSPERELLSHAEGGDTEQLKSTPTSQREKFLVTLSLSLSLSLPRSQHDFVGLRPPGQPTTLTAENVSSLSPSSHSFPRFPVSLTCDEAKAHVTCHVNIFIE